MRFHAIHQTRMTMDLVQTRVRRDMMRFKGKCNWYIKLEWRCIWYRRVCRGIWWEPTKHGLFVWVFCREVVSGRVKTKRGLWFLPVFPTAFKISAGSPEEKSRQFRNGNEVSSDKWNSNYDGFGTDACAAGYYESQRKKACVWIKGRHPLGKMSSFPKFVHVYNTVMNLSFPSSQWHCEGGNEMQYCTILYTWTNFGIKRIVERVLSGFWSIWISGDSAFGWTETWKQPINGTFEGEDHTFIAYDKKKYPHARTKKEKLIDNRSDRYFEDCGNSHKFWSVTKEIGIGGDSHKFWRVSKATGIGGDNHKLWSSRKATGYLLTHDQFNTPLSENILWIHDQYVKPVTSSLIPLEMMRLYFETAPHYRELFPVHRSHWTV